MSVNSYVTIDIQCTSIIMSMAEHHSYATISIKIISISIHNSTLLACHYIIIDYYMYIYMYVAIYSCTLNVLGGLLLRIQNQLV
jgi:hypothetical protein